MTQDRPASHPVPNYDDEDEGFFTRVWQRRKAKRRAKKTRIAAMTRGRRVLRRGLITGTWFLGLLAAIMIFAIVAFYTLTDVPRPEQLSLPQVATIQYSDGSTLARIGNVDRTIVSLDQVPKQVRYAVLAAEDRGFYGEPAISVTGTMRAAWKDVTGGQSQGGSGITQQYVKNAYLTNEQTLSRKLKELMIAVKLSREYSKDQILEFYLNTVYFGRNTYGIQAASKAFFGTDVQDLDTAQGALLAGLLRAPGYYDPAVHAGQAKQRWRYVLDGMVKTGHLTAQGEAALKFPTTQPLGSNGIGTVGWKYLVKNKVLADLEAHGISADEVSARGLSIRTTIDRNAQMSALKAVHDGFTGLTPKQRNLKTGLVAVNPSDGAVLAYYGGSGPEVKGNDGKVDSYDYASQGARPPGSSFKPFTLATVLSQTIAQTEGQVHYAINSKVNGSYCAKIEGTKICNDPGDESVSSSRIEIAKAMKYSLNTTFDQLASEAGPSAVAATAHKLGVATKDSSGNRTLSDAKGSTNFGIGIGDYPVSVLDMASSYGTLANKGVRNDPYLVQRATSYDGQTVYAHKTAPTRAINARVANDVTLTLEPIAAYSGRALANGRESAAKTGTEGLTGRGTNNSDAWMVGYTPQVSAAVWMGSGTNQPIYRSDGQPMYGADLPGKTWKKFMDGYLAGKKKMSMADEQQVDIDGLTPTAQPSYTPDNTPSYTPSATSKTPKPSFSVSSGFPSSAAVPSPSFPAASSTTTRTKPKPSKTKTTRANCGGVLQRTCPPGG